MPGRGRPFGTCLILLAAGVLLFLRAGILCGAAPPQGKALWVVRTTLLSRAGIDRMIDQAARAGFNTLIVQVCGRGDAYFDSRVYPPAEDYLEASGTGFDPLAYTLQQAHARGLKVHAWVNVLLVWSSGTRPRDPRHVLNGHPEWMMVDRQGESLGGYSPATIRKLGLTGVYLSVAGDEACRLLEKFILDLASRYPLDGLHLDYIRYPAATVDFSPRARQEFSAAWGIDPAVLENDSAGLIRTRGQQEYDQLRRCWTEYRAELITRFLRKLAGHLDTINPRLERSAAVMPEIDSAYRVFGQDWPRWVKEGLLDRVLPMAYSTDPGVVYRQISAACDAVGPDRVWAGLRAYEVPTASTLERAHRIRPLGVAGYCFFSYDGVRNNSVFFERMKSDLFGR